MAKHILVISQYFFPENFRINDLCKEWVNRGYKVTVVTGIPNYPEGNFFKGYSYWNKRKEQIDGINVIRLSIIPRKKNSLMLIMNYLSFVISGGFWSIFSKIKPDYVFIFEVSPMTQALPGVWFSKRRKIPCYLYVQDLWPENLEIVGGVKNKVILKRVDKMVNYIYKRCTKIFVTSQSFKRNIENRGITSTKVIYWPQYAEEFYIPLQKENFLNLIQDNRFNIMFTGNIGEAQGLNVLPVIANRLKRDNYASKIIFTIIGDGRYKKELINQIKDLGVDDMFLFIERQPAIKIPEYLAIANVAFVSFSENVLFMNTIPAKLQSYMACSKPIFAVASGETENIIKNANCGLCSKPGDVDGSLLNLLKLYALKQDELAMMGSRGRDYYNREFDKKRLIDLMEDYFR